MMMQSPEFLLDISCNNPWITVPPVRCNRNPTWDRKLRMNCAKHYGALKWTLRHGTQLQCSVTGLWAPWECIVDAHLVPEAMASCRRQQDVLSLLNMTKAMVEEPCNQMPLLETIEVAYQQQQLCFVLYDEDDDSLQVRETRYTIRLLDPQLASQTVHHDKKNTLTFAQLQGKPFALPVAKTKNQPLARCLSLHAQCSYQRAKQEGWSSSKSRPVEYGSPLDTDWIEVPITVSSNKNKKVSSPEEPRTNDHPQRYCGYETDSLSLCSLEG